MNGAIPVAGRISGEAAMRPEARSRYKTAAIVVTYRAPATIQSSLAAIKQQLDELVVVDNGSASETRQILATIAQADNCHVIFNPSNVGIGAALNLGMDYAAQQSCDLVLLLDQDSLVGSAFISQMKATYAAGLSNGLVNNKVVGMVVPTYIDERSGAPMPLTEGRNGSVLAGMTSGSLLPMSTYRRCGRFEESFFIDYVDIEYCLRLSGSGFSIVQSPSATLLHSLGRVQSYTLGPFHFSVTNHSSARRYYISRNRTLLHGRYLMRRPLWVALDLRAMVMETIKIVLVEDDRWQKLRLTLKGIVDAALGRTGYRDAL